MSVYLYASDVAAACGLNQYKSYRDVIKKYLQTKEEAKVADYVVKDNKKLVEQAGNEVQKERTKTIDIIKKTKDINSIKLENPVEQKVVEEIKSGKTTVKQEEAVITKEIITKITKEAVFTPDTKKSVKIEREIVKDLPKDIQKTVTSHVNKSRGTEHEAKIIDKYEKKHETVVKDRNSKLYTIHVCGITIYGRIDGYDEKNNKLIEVKNRRNNLFGYIPEYERVQCEIYMKMLKVDTCTHVEQYGDETNVTEYCSDIRLLQEIDRGLVKYKHKFLKYKAKMK